MTELHDYIDARELTTGYKRALCPEPTCGVERWFKHRAHHTTRDMWHCQSCGNRRRHILEYPCPECGIRLDIAGNMAFCQNQSCEFDSVDIPKSKLIDRLSEEHDTRGMPRALMGECPICEDEYAINGGPDGELVCRENNDFYAGRYSDEWYCYAIWMENPDRIRVNTDL